MCTVAGCSAGVAGCVKSPVAAARGRHKSSKHHSHITLECAGEAAHLRFACHGLHEARQASPAHPQVPSFPSLHVHGYVPCTSVRSSLLPAAVTPAHLEVAPVTLRSTPGPPVTCTAAPARLLSPSNATFSRDTAELGAVGTWLVPAAADEPCVQGGSLRKTVVTMWRAPARQLNGSGMPPTCPRDAPPWQPAPHRWRCRLAQVYVRCWPVAALHAPGALSSSRGPRAPEAPEGAQRITEAPEPLPTIESGE